MSNARKRCIDNCIDSEWLFRYRICPLRLNPYLIAASWATSPELLELLDTSSYGTETLDLQCDEADTTRRILVQFTFSAV
ncbi:hypothetical protein TSAR_000463 [Trichomalopsis sarcophagae]|uniref:Uncharacterized protein n=1 Tax=Trichomalopsis sarcophagae TaxID=543379 RepID=A0A232F7V5_9HYME|nr:hypothetical protein TSAR_000463 [Trichomalopsis sarcophagae]